MALQALSEYAILSYVGGVNLTISLASTNLDFQETFELNRENKKLLQSAKVITSMEREISISHLCFLCQGYFSVWFFSMQMSHFRLFALVDSSLSVIIVSSTNPQTPVLFYFPHYYSD